MSASSIHRACARSLLTFQSVNRRILLSSNQRCFHKLSRTNNHFPTLPQSKRFFTQPSQAAEQQSQSSEQSPSSESKDQQPIQQQQNEHEQTIATLRKQISELETKSKDLYDRYLRALSDAENARHRAKVDVENASKFSITNFSKSLIDVADTLELAANSVKKDVERTEDQLIKSIYEGLLMIEKTLQKAFESHGVKKFDPTGERFDPNKHSCLFQISDSSKEPNSVAQTVKPGYICHERVIRPAQVGTVRPLTEEEKAAMEK